MSAAAWITLVIGGLTLLLNVTALAVGYGVLLGTVKAIAARVTAIEAELKLLGDLKIELAGMKATLGALLEQFKDLNSAVRWLREPAPPYRPHLPKGASE